MSTSDLTLVLLEKLGGMDNIESVSNCKTRVRVNVKDKDLVNNNELKSLEEVIGVVPFGSQIQIILGPRTSEMADVLLNKLKLQNDNK